MKSRCLSIALVASLTMALAACGDDDDDGAAAAAEDDSSQEIADVEPEEAEPPQLIEFKATDYAFDAPTSFSGGLVEMTLDNLGKEGHFAAFAKPTEGTTADQVEAAIMALASGQHAEGPPPFVEYMALGTIDPGGQSRMTANVPAGDYVIFCMVPAPDGAPHAAKGMMTTVEVTEGRARGLPETDATISAADFAIGGVPTFKPGKTSITLQNKGKQIHEIDLVELPEGKKVEDVVAWAAKMAGPPPARFLGGPAILQDLSANTTFELKAGSRYAFVCVVPDHLSDGAPHITKGMYTPEFQTGS